MELKTIEGIIISEKDYGETSKIVNVITKDYGIIGFISKGSKRLKSDLRSVSQMFTYASFNVSYKKDKLSTLLSASVINSLSNIKKDIVKTSYLNFICDLTKQVLNQSSSSKIYDIFINSILKINDGYDETVISNILELQYLDYLGVTPCLDKCVVCGRKGVATLSASKGGFVCNNHLDNDYIVSEKTIRMIRLLKYVDISKISKLDVSDTVKKEINNFIDDYYERYTGLYLKSKSFLKNIVKLS